MKTELRDLLTYPEAFQDYVRDNYSAYDLAMLASQFKDQQMNFAPQYLAQCAIGMLFETYQQIKTA